MERKREVSNDFMLRRGIIAMKTEGVIVKVVHMYAWPFVLFWWIILITFYSYTTLLTPHIFFSEQQYILFMHHLLSSTNLTIFFFELFGLIPLCKDAEIY